MPTASGSIAFLGAARFQGFWNADTNEATGSGLEGGAPFHPQAADPGDGYSTLLINGGYHSSTNLTASAGDYWQITGSGATSINGQTPWNLNDWCIYSGSASDAGVWRRLGFEDTIASIVVGDLSSSSFHMSAENDKHIIFAAGSVHSGSNDFVYDYTNSRVGIGTATPAALLEIAVDAPASNAQPQEMLRLAVTDAGVDMAAGTGPAITFYVGETSGQDWGGTLAVVREAESDVDSATAMVFHTSADDEVPDNDREKMRITSTGNVGIGVTDPDSLLEIFGTSTQLKLSYDATNYSTLATGATGGLTITTVDPDAAEADLTLVVDGDIILGPAGGDVLPDADDSRNLGSISKRWANVYTGDLHLKNDRGDWTILEEEDYLCVVNNKTGKKYEMMLKEIKD